MVELGSIMGKAWNIPMMGNRETTLTDTGFREKSQSEEQSNGTPERILP